LQSESGRKACASRDKQSCIFSSSDAGAAYRPLRVVNIKTPEVAEKTRRVEMKPIYLSDF
jgi:hypothetical protein